MQLTRARRADDRYKAPCPADSITREEVEAAIETALKVRDKCAAAIARLHAVPPSERGAFEARAAYIRGRVEAVPLATAIALDNPKNFALQQVVALCCAAGAHSDGLTYLQMITDEFLKAQIVRDHPKLGPVLPS